MFSDEKCFYGAGFCGRTYVVRPPGERNNPIYCVNKTPRPVKVNAWCCFCSTGGTIHTFYENLDSQGLADILKDHLLKAADLNFVDEHAGGWLLLHDNDSKFKGRKCQQWIGTAGIDVLDDFPPCSPDLNPTENLWNELARAVEKYQPETQEELADRIMREWMKISTSYLRSLVHSMPKRCQEVIAAQGSAIEY